MSTNQDSGLKVRVYNVAHQNFEGEQDLGNCVLSQLVPDAAERIIAVKIDDDLLQATKDKEYNEHLYYSQLENLNLGNCTEVLLASGSTVYMTDPEIATQVRDTFFMPSLMGETPKTRRLFCKSILSKNATCAASLFCFSSRPLLSLRFSFSI